MNDKCKQCELKDLYYKTEINNKIREIDRLNKQIAILRTKLLDKMKQNVQ